MIFTLVSPEICSARFKLEPVSIKIARALLIRIWSIRLAISRTVGAASLLRLGMIDPMILKPYRAAKYPRLS